MTIYSIEAIVDGNMGLSRPGVERYAFPNNLEKLLEPLTDENVSIAVGWGAGPHVLIHITSEHDLSAERLLDMNGEIRRILSPHANVQPMTVS